MPFIYAITPRNSPSTERIYSPADDATSSADAPDDSSYAGYTFKVSEPDEFIPYMINAIQQSSAARAFSQYQNSNAINDARAVIEAANYKFKRRESRLFRFVSRWTKPALLMKLKKYLRLVSISQTRFRIRERVKKRLTRFSYGILSKDVKNIVLTTLRHNKKTDQNIPVKDNTN